MTGESGPDNKRADRREAWDLSQSPLAFATTGGAAHVIRYANDAFNALLSSGAITLGNDLLAGHGPGDLTPLLDRVFKTGIAVQDELLSAPNDVTPRWSCTVWPVAETAFSGRGLMMEVRDTANAEGERNRQRELAGRLLLGALKDRDAAREAKEGSRLANFLATATRDLVMSHDEDATLAIMQRYRLPRADTWCIVDIVEPNGDIHRLAVTHPDPAKQALARTLAETWHPHADDEIGVPRLLRTSGGLPVAVTEDSGTKLLDAAHGARNLEILRQLGFGSLLVAPLVVRSKILGAITFVSRRGDTPFTKDEIVVASDLADRCAMALENARLYRETNALRIAADIANGAKSAFLGNMSHELRTPLNAIGGYADLIDLGIRGPVTQEQHEDLARIKLNQQRLLKLIAEILNFVSNQGAYTAVRPTPVIIETALSEAVELIKSEAEARELKLERLPCDPEVIVMGETGRIQQILVNLLTNAVKYTPLGGGAITLFSTVHRDVVKIMVADAGPGIPADQFDAIFEPFIQLMSGLTNRQGGVGLGLAISRELARAMKGDLTVESEVGVGSTFTLTLPRAP